MNDEQFKRGQVLRHEMERLEMKVRYIRDEKAIQRHGRYYADDFGLDADWLEKQMDAVAARALDKLEAELQQKRAEFDAL